MKIGCTGYKISTLLDLIRRNIIIHIFKNLANGSSIVFIHTYILLIVIAGIGLIGKHIILTHLSKCYQIFIVDLDISLNIIAHNIFYINMAVLHPLKLV